jgi:hypothetical protein
VFHFPDASGVTYVDPHPPGLIRYVDPDIPAALAFGGRHPDFRPMPAVAPAQPRSVHMESLFGRGRWVGEGARAMV